MWVFDQETKKIVNKPITYVPGLYKIYDEILINASDNKQRDPLNMTKIEIDINPTENYIRILNNGKSIPITIHKEYNIYIAELIFGNLLTGSNFDDKEEKTTGGRNGYGAKLANIFSTKFIIETASKEEGLTYYQEFSNNMKDKKEPKIEKKNVKDDFTAITFYPDLKRFNMDCLDDDIVSLFYKRAYDIAATSSGSLTAAANSKKNILNVYLNKELLQIKTVSDYLQTYTGLEEPIVLEKMNDRWEIGVGISDGSFSQISFVNSIATTKGGSHINYITDQVVNRLAAFIKKKSKSNELKNNYIKNHLFIFINCLIINPSFDSQTKEFLTTKQANFGSVCEISEKIFKTLEKNSNLIDTIMNYTKFKQINELKKKSNSSKKNNLVGIPKLDDANFAGTSKSQNCTLILTEGDSAKSLAISGLSVIGRDYYGVFPLRGKLLNVREATHQQIMNNEEIQNITKILGLQFGKTYTDLSSLRYGHLMIMTDQDHDGSHIKGLLINFLHFFWPSLLKIDNFLQQFITPIIKCFKKSSSDKFLSFYTLPEYHEWKSNNNDGKGWRIKYYKGLGTSTSSEAKDYFSNLPTHEINFDWESDQSGDMIDMAFSKKRVEERKLWLLSKQPDVFMDYKVKKINYDSFINKELILFSHADNIRSIAHFLDGFKPSQRKILFSCFKRNLKQEIKVVQLAGYVSEHSAYHHGEQSLTQTIINMAQNFLGSNNINLLTPCGQFGTRLLGGKDSASARYVFTKLEKITRFIFHPDDDLLLDYLDDDGQKIEPEFYVPIIPMVLINGCEGIGTGWSSSVPLYNPRDIIENIKLMLDHEEPNKMTPWYRGFQGTIEEKTGGISYSTIGNIEQIDDQTLHISELPIGKWTSDYKQFLETLVIGNAALKEKEKKDKEKDKEKDKDTEDKTKSSTAPFIKDFKENHTDVSVSFTLNIAPEKVAELVKDKASLIKKFKLETSLSINNMNLFDLNSTIKKFDTPLHILKEFYNIRLTYYDRRRVLLINKLKDEWDILDNKVRFILAVINNELVVSNRKKAEIFKDLIKMKFKLVTNNITNKPTQNEENDSEEDDQADSKDDINSRGYDYLLGMKIWSLTYEKVLELQKLKELKKKELDDIIASSAEQLWKKDLSDLEVVLDEFDQAIEDEKEKLEKAQKKANKNRPQPKKRVVKKVVKKVDSNDDSSSDEMDISDYEEEKSKPKPKSNPKPAATTLKPSITKPSTIASFMNSSSSSSSVPVVSSQSTPVEVTSTKTKAPTKKKSDESTSNTPTDDFGSLFKDPIVTESKPKTQKAPAKSKVVDTINLSEETSASGNAITGLSLFERLQLKKKALSGGDALSSLSSSTSSSSLIDLSNPAEKSKPVPAKKASKKKDDSEDELLDTDEEEVVKKPKAKAPAKSKAEPKAKAAPKKTATKKSKKDSDSEDDSDIVEVTPIKSPIAKRVRRTTTAKKSYVESEDEDHIDDSFIVEDDEEEDDDDDYDD